VRPAPFYAGPSHSGDTATKEYPFLDQGLASADIDVYADGKLSQRVSQIAIERDALDRLGSQEAAGLAVLLRINLRHAVPLTFAAP
jgi:hypothetical protein